MCRYQTEICTANSGDSYYDKCIKLPQRKSAVCTDTVTLTDECTGLFSFPFIAEGQAQKGFPSTDRICFQSHVFGFVNISSYQPPLFVQVSNPGVPPSLHTVPVVIKNQNLSAISPVILGAADEWE